MPFDRSTPTSRGQIPLFDQIERERLPAGLVYQADWLTEAEERAAIEQLRPLPFRNATYKSYTARRRVVGYGGRYDFDRNRLMPAPPLVDGLCPLRARVADWLGVEPATLAHVLVSEYAPGTPLGWHRDVPDFEVIAGLSLGGPATMRFRPHPPHSQRRPDIVRLDLAPRSIYAMRGPARWAWQHCVAPVDVLRWSITFRTLRRPR